MAPAAHATRLQPPHRQMQLCQLAAGGSGGSLMHAWPVLSCCANPLCGDSLNQPFRAGLWSLCGSQATRSSAASHTAPSQVCAATLLAVQWHGGLWQASRRLPCRQAGGCSCDTELGVPCRWLAGQASTAWQLERSHTCPAASLVPTVSCIPHPCCKCRHACGSARGDCILRRCTDAAGKQGCWCCCC